MMIIILCPYLLLLLVTSGTFSNIYNSPLTLLLVCASVILIQRYTGKCYFKLETQGVLGVSCLLHNNNNLQKSASGARENCLKMSPIYFTEMLLSR